MNKTFKQSALKIAVTSALVLGGITSALAGVVGGAVPPINTLTQTPISNITIVAATGQTDTTIASGTIDNNNPGGWKLTVASANAGKLIKTTGGGAGREILYTNVKLITTGGTLGAGLTAPTSTKNIVTGVSGGAVAGSTIFNTGSAVGTPGTATTATVGYAYSLLISWSADTSLLAGSYQDTITLTLANDA